MPASQKMADSGERRMNLAALQRLDPYITHIVTTASQVALYKFNGSTNEWEKTEIEGTLFVYGRCARPYHGFIIMNRLNRNNLVEPLTTEMEFQRQDPFLLYKNSQTVIYGIWFYNKDDCTQIDGVMNRLMDNMNRPRKDDVNSNRSRSTSSGGVSLQRPPSSESKNVDIVSMLTKAQNEYNQTKGRTEPKRITDNAVELADLIRPRPVRMGNSSGPPPDLTMGSSAVTRSPDVEGTSLSVAALFASAGGRQVAESGDTGNLTKRTTTVLEANDRFANKPDCFPECTSPISESLHSVLQRLISKQDSEKDSREQSRNSSMLFSMNGSDMTKYMALNPNLLGERSPLEQEFRAPRLNVTPSAGLGVPIPATSGVSEISLMSPMMFSNPKASLPSYDEILSASPNLPHVNPLTKEQLGQALIYLIKNDRDFLTTIHEAYVKSLTMFTSERAKRDNT